MRAQVIPHSSNDISIEFLRNTYVVEERLSALLFTIDSAGIRYVVVKSVRIWREKIAESFPLKGRAGECFFFLFLDTFLEYFCFKKILNYFLKYVFYVCMSHIIYILSLYDVMLTDIIRRKIEERYFS